MQCTVDEIKRRHDKNSARLIMCICIVHTVVDLYAPVKEYHWWIANRDVTNRATGLLQMLIVAHLFQNFIVFLEPEGSLPCLQGLSRVGSCPELIEFSPLWIAKMFLIFWNLHEGLKSEVFKAKLYIAFLYLYHVPDPSYPWLLVSLKLIDEYKF